MREIQTEIRRDTIENKKDRNQIEGKASTKSKVQTGKTSGQYSYSINDVYDARTAASVERRRATAIKEFKEAKQKLSDIAESCPEITANFDFSLNQAKEISKLAKNQNISLQSRHNLKTAAQNVQKAQEEFNTALDDFRKSVKYIESKIELESYDFSKIQSLTKQAQEAIDKISQAKAKAKSSISELNTFSNTISEKTQIKASRAAMVSKFKNAATGTVIGAVNKGIVASTITARKISEFSSNNDSGSTVANQVKEVAEASVSKSFRASNKAVKKINQQIKTAKKSAKTSKKTLKTVKKKTLKTTARTAKTTVKTAEKTAAAASKTAKTTSKAMYESAKAAAHAAAEAAKAAAQLASKIAVKISEAIVALAESPVGLIVLVVCACVVLVVVIINIIQGAVQIPVSSVGAIGSSLSWLLDGDENNNTTYDNIAALYREYEQKAISAMESTRTYYLDQIGEISFEERDSLVLNDASFYPASSADGYIQSFFAGINYDDYVYLLEICSIKKLRDENSDQVTFEETDIFNFLTGYCYDFDITIISNQPCPTSDCKSITWYHPDGDCPDVSEDDDTCVGHLYYFCDQHHKKVIITIQQVSKNILENDVLILTDTEKSMLNLGVELIKQAILPQEVTT